MLLNLRSDLVRPRSARGPLVKVLHHPDELRLGKLVACRLHVDLGLLPFGLPVLFDVLGVLGDRNGNTTLRQARQPQEPPAQGNMGRPTSKTRLDTETDGTPSPS